jgi:hypothetical protein
MIQPEEETARDLAIYLRDHYGECSIYDPKKKHSCNCLDPSPQKGYTRNSVCPHWVPCGASTWEELGAIMKKKYE